MYSPKFINDVQTSTKTFVDIIRETQDLDTILTLIITDKPCKKKSRKKTSRKKTKTIINYYTSISSS